MGLFTLALLVASGEASSSAFTGTWLIDIPSSMTDAEPERYSVKQGMFKRGGSKGGVIVRADGRYHKIPSDGYVDEVAISSLDRRSVREFDRLDGKLVYTVSYLVSPGGNSMVEKVTDYTKPDHRPVRTTITHHRVGPLRRSRALLTGQWRVEGLSTTKSHLTEVLRLEGNHFISADPAGVGYDAIIGGVPVPISGDAADARAAVRMPNDRTVIVQMSRSGKPTVKITMTMQRGGSSIRVAARRENEVVDTSWVMHRL